MSNDKEAYTQFTLRKRILACFQLPVPRQIEAKSNLPARERSKDVWTRLPPISDSYRLCSEKCYRFHERAILSVDTDHVDSLVVWRANCKPFRDMWKVEVATSWTRFKVHCTYRTQHSLLCKHALARYNSIDCAGSKGRISSSEHRVGDDLAGSPVGARDIVSDFACYS